MKKGLVSIIVPVYNAERFLEDTIKTIQDQTYENWEAIFVDDCSKDNSVKILENAKKYDDRIKIIKLKKNSRAAAARNEGIKASKGEFLCFLDADDFWVKDKLELQVEFIKNNDYEFIFGGYEFANSEGVPTGKVVRVPAKMNYNDALKNTTISTCTVMFNMNKLTKEQVYMPLVVSEDTACWWKILKIIDYAYGMNNILAYYRRSENTLSSNKLVAIRRIWFLYRKVEKLSIHKSIYCFVHYAVRAVIRRI